MEISPERRREIIGALRKGTVPQRPRRLMLEGDDVLLNREELLLDRHRRGLRRLSRSARRRRRRHGDVRLKMSHAL